MAIIRWDPFAEINALQQQVNSLFDSSLAAQQNLAPATDIYSDDQGLTIEAHLPNFQEDEINVNLHDSVVEISAEHSEKEEDKKKYYMRESASSYYRRVALPKNVDEDKLEAHFAKGILKVTVPFKALPEPKKVKIGAKTSDKKLDKKSPK
jgi:HSP20 family protein